MTAFSDELEARISKALSIAQDSAYEGEHHKMWVIDQMVRALTGCPLVEKRAMGLYGKPYTYEAQGESVEYAGFLAKLDSWDEGVSP